MTSIILAIIASSAIANVLKLFSKIKDLKILQIFLGNYLLAFVFSLFMNDLPLQKSRPLEIGLGMFTGLLFLLCFLIYQKNIHINGISLSIGAMRFSLIIPTFFSIIYFKEHLHLLNFLGIIIVPIAFMFLVNFKHFHSLMMLLLLFIFTGFNDLNMKLYEHFGYESSGLFIVYLFGGAFLFNVILVIYKKSHLHFRSIAFGLLLGIPNQLTSKYFLDALKTLKASVAFPVFAAGVLLISILTDIIIWRKKFSNNQKYALLFLFVGIILINLKF